MYNNPIPSLISKDLIKIIQEDPDKYYKELCDLSLKYKRDFIKKIVNCTQYETYCGNHLHTLIYMVGDLFYEESKEKKIFGAHLSISEDLGIMILEKLIKYDVSLYNTNYYKENPLQNISSSSFTKRKNNTRFKRKLQQYYIDDLNKELPLKSKETKMIG